MNALARPAAGLRRPVDGNLIEILGLAGALSAADNWVAAALLPSMAQAFGVSTAAAGLALVSYLVPYGLMQPVGGAVADRLGKVRVLRWSLAGLALGTGACAAAPGFLFFCLMRAFTGACAASIIAVSLAHLGDSLELSARQEKVGRFMGWVFMGQGLGVGAGGVLAQAVSWRVMLVGLSLMAGVSLALTGRLEDRCSYCSGSGGFLRRAGRMLASGKGRSVFPVAGAAGFLFLGMYAYLGAYLQREGLSSCEAGMVMMAFGAAGLAAGRCVAWMPKRLGRNGTLQLGFGLGAGAAWTWMACGSWEAGLAGTVLLGAAYILVQSTLATAAFEVSPGSTGLASALVGLGLFGGGGVGSAMAGMLLKQGSFRILWLASGAVAIGLLAVMRLGRSFRVSPAK